MPWDLMESVRRGGESLKRLRSGTGAPGPVPAAAPLGDVGSLPPEARPVLRVLLSGFERLTEMLGTDLPEEPSTLAAYGQYVEEVVERTLSAVQTARDQARHQQLQRQQISEAQPALGTRVQTESPRSSTPSDLAQLRQLQQDIEALHQDARRANIILHTPLTYTHGRLMKDVEQVLLAADSTAPSLLPSSLQPMTTSSTNQKMWRLRLPDIDTKHAVFAGSKLLRQQRVFLDDDLSRRQLDGRRSLAPRRLQLKQSGHATWSRHDTLCWDEGGRVQRLRPDWA